MAKPPPVVRCRIVCTKEVDVSDVGPTMLKLSELGFDNISTDFVSDVPKFRQKTNHEVKAEDFLIDWIADHATFKAKEAVVHFEANQRAAGSCYSALRNLVERRLLKKLGEGNYSRANVKALPSPKKNYDPPHPVFAMRLISRNHGHCSRQWMKDQFEKEGRPGASAPSALNDLVNSKQLKRVGEGQYELPKKKEKKPKAKPKAAAKVATNGAATEVTTNGH